MRKRGDARARGLEPLAERAPYAGAREKTVHEDDHVVTGVMARHHRCEVVSHQHHFAQRRARLGAGPEPAESAQTEQRR